jgi:DNA-binding transcriptional LysR family regulator
VTLVPRLAVAEWPSLAGRVHARPIEDKGAHRRVRLVFRRDMPRRKALEALADVVREGAPECVRRLVAPRPSA